MEVKDVLEVIKALVAPDSASQQEGSLPERLTVNLEAFHALLEQPKFMALSQEMAKLRDETLTARGGLCAVYLDFTVSGLALLNALNRSLSQPDKLKSPTQDGQPTSQPPAPANLLSMADRKAIGVLVQFIVSLGLYPYLLPGLDALIQFRMTTAAGAVPRATSLSPASRARHLYKCCRMLVRCFEDPVLVTLLMPRHLTDVLAALIQVCYGPGVLSESQQPPGVDQQTKTDSIGTQNTGVSEAVYLLEKERCAEELQKLLNRVHQPQIVRELISLQSMSVSTGRKVGEAVRVVKGPQWLRKACGELLSERLMQKNGVQHVLRGVFEATSGGSGGESVEEAAGDWRKCQAVSRIISSCPARATSIDDYYSLICPQVLALLHLPESGVGKHFLRVAVTSFSTMSAQQSLLANKHISIPLMWPLMQLAGELPLDKSEVEPFGSSLQICIDDLGKICSVAEPSSPILASLVPYLPVVFEVWQTCQSEESRSVVSRALKPLDAAITLQLFKHLAHVTTGHNVVNSANVAADVCTDDNAVKFRRVLPKYGLRLNEASVPVLCLLDDDHSRETVDAMESIGDCLLEVLKTDFKSTAIPSQLFIECLRHIALELCRVSGCDVAGTSLERLMDERKKKPLESGAGSSSELLELERKLEQHSSAESFFNALVLYLTASLCEHMTDYVLKHIQLLELLDLMAIILQSHACFVQHQPTGSKLSLQMVQPNVERMLGGSITLSIVFGLLSAILGGAREVTKTERPLLSAILPPLQVIAECYPEEEISRLANDLRICIATLGAVWSAEMKELAAGKKGRVEKVTRKAKSSAKTDLPKATAQKLKEPPHLLGSNLPSDTTLPPATRALAINSDSSSEKPLANDVPSTHSEHSKRTALDQALEDARDPLIPVRGHGLLALAKLLEKRDLDAVAKQEELLVLFKENLSHPDSFIYLGAIKGLIALASVSLKRTLPLLCREYANLTHVDSDDIRRDTGQMIRAEACSLPTSHNIQVRLKLGEALVRIVKDCGELVPHHSNTILAAVLVNSRNPDPLLRASSLSNLAEVCPLMKFSFAQIQNEILSCVTHILTTDGEVKVRQAALLVIKQIIKGHSQHAVEALGDSLRDIYRLLKHVVATETDKLTCAHAMAALGELELVMKDYLFPQPTLSKKITILGN